MQIGKDISISCGDLYIVHHNIPNKKCSAIFFSEHILFMPLQGKITITIDDKSYSASPGEMIYMPPSTAHSFLSSGKIGERVIAISSSPILNQIKINAPCAILPINSLIKEILFYLLLNSKTNNSALLTELFSRAIVESFETYYTDHFIDHLMGKIKDHRVKTSLTIMRTHLDATLTDIAKKSALSIRNFNRLVLKETGIQPKKLMTHFRMQAAKKLLLKKQSSITDIALEVGYQSVSQFISVFRSYAGLLPSDFAKQS